MRSSVQGMTKMFQNCHISSYVGPINEMAAQFLNNLGHRIASTSADDKEGQYLFQRLSVALQRYNAILLHESFVVCE